MEQQRSFLRPRSREFQTPARRRRHLSRGHRDARLDFARRAARHGDEIRGGSENRERRGFVRDWSQSDAQTNRGLFAAWARREDVRDRLGGGLHARQVRRLDDALAKARGPSAARRRKSMSIAADRTSRIDRHIRKGARPDHRGDTNRRRLNRRLKPRRLRPPNYAGTFSKWARNPCWPGRPRSSIPGELRVRTAPGTDQENRIQSAHIARRVCGYAPAFAFESYSPGCGRAPACEHS